MTDRRKFIKGCVWGMCLCGSGPLFKMEAMVRIQAMGQNNYLGESGNNDHLVNTDHYVNSDDSVNSVDTGNTDDSMTTDKSVNDAVNKEESFMLKWITTLLSSLNESGLSEDQIRKVVKDSCIAHHDLLDVPEMVKPYVGKPNEFIEFLKHSWGWLVTVDEQNKKIYIDENKPVCVCPLLKNERDKLYPALCYCSEGFAEKMFSYVYGYPVEARVAASVHRGHPSCRYEINF